MGRQTRAAALARHLDLLESRESTRRTWKDLVLRKFGTVLRLQLRRLYDDDDG